MNNVMVLLVVLAIIVVVLALFVSQHLALAFLVVGGLCVALALLLGRGGGRPLA